jgi:hypothetical protein
MRLRFFLLATIIAFLQINLFAEHVSPEKASQVGMNFMKQRHTYLDARGVNLKMYKSIELTQVTNRSVENQHFYVFNLNDNQGWVLVADDDRCIPILAYSKYGEFVTENLPANVEDWLKGISSEVQYVIDNDIVADETTTRQWKELFSGISTEFINNRGEKVVNPLVQTRWNQSPYYNDLCPYDNYYHDRTVTGCVATAMAQVMKYWNHPAVGSGSHSYSTSSYGTLYANFGGTNYDWTNMPNRVTSTNNAVATLMYHCGVSVDMEYGVAQTGGSGAFVISSYTNSEHCAEYSFKNHFGYKSTAHGERKDYTSDSQWKSMLRADLDASRPVLYAGFGNGGHCFVCDGYDNNDKFHFNWGWDGQNDGYFSLSALNPGSGGAGGGSYSFTNNQQAIFNLEPNNGGGGGGGGGGSTNADLRLYSALSMESQIWFGSEISVTASVGNWGTNTYTGYIGAAAFDADGNFIDFINYSSLNLGSNHHQNYTFSTSQNMVFVPGDYQVALFYKTGNEDWTIVDNGNYSNHATFQIYYYDDIETYSNFTIISNSGRLIQGSTAKVNVDVANTGNSTYYGKVRVNLSTLDGNWVQNIGIIDVNGLGSGYHYENGLTFQGEITAEPGTYHMELAYYDNGWYYAGAYYHSNPVTVVVEAPANNADQYENNNTQAQAYKLRPSNWSNHQTTVGTTGSSIHVGNDIDYYRIELPTGYNYTITARLHDSYNSGNGQTYTVDAMFAYSTDGQNYSDGIDDVMSGSITFHGGNIYFVVSPYFSGMTGTYLLEITIRGDGDTGVDEEYAINVNLYPNPMKDVLHLECDNIRQYDIYSLDGKLVKSAQLFDNESVINVKNLSSGIYMIRITSEKGVVTRRIVKE